MRLALWPLVLFLILCLGAGCNSAQNAATTSPGLEPGWTRYAVEAGGSTIALPPGWQSLDVDPAKFETGLATILDNNPNLATVSEGARRAIQNGVKFYAMDVASGNSGDGSIASVSVVRLTGASPPSLDEVVKSALDALTTMQGAATDVARERVVIDGAPAERVSYRLTVAMPSGGNTLIHMTHYILVRGRDGYSIACGVPDSRTNEYSAICQRIGQSFDLTEQGTGSATAGLIGTALMLAAAALWLISMLRRRARASREMTTISQPPEG